MVHGVLGGGGAQSLFDISLLSEKQNLMPYKRKSLRFIAS